MTGKARDQSRTRRFYIDSSAYLCILLGEQGAQQLSREIEGAEVMSSVLLLLETKRNLVRLARQGHLDTAQYKACIDQVEKDTNTFLFRDLTLDLCQSSALPAVVTPRSLDLAHLRTALAIHSESRIDRFVTRDMAQEDAARELGLPV